MRAFFTTILVLVSGAYFGARIGSNTHPIFGFTIFGGGLVLSALLLGWKSRYNIYSIAVKAGWDQNTLKQQFNITPPPLRRLMRWMNETYRSSLDYHERVQAWIDLRNRDKRSPPYQHA